MILSDLQIYIFVYVSIYLQSFIFFYIEGGSERKIKNIKNARTHTHTTKLQHVLIHSKLNI